MRNARFDVVSSKHTSGCRLSLPKRQPEVCLDYELEISANTSALACRLTKKWEKKIVFEQYSIVTGQGNKISSRGLVREWLKKHI